MTFEPNSVDFDSDPRSYTLSYADGSSPDTGSIPAGALTHTFDQPGSYLVRLEVDDGKATATDFATIAVFDPTSLAADAGSDRIAQVGEPLRFSGGNSSPSGVIDSYAWDFGDGQTASGQRVFHTFDTPGDYTVELVVAGAGSSATDQVAVSVVPEGTGTGLSVRVVDESSQPIPGAIVSVELPDGNAATADTNPSGEARLLGLADGDYSVAIAQAGFIPEIRSVQVADGSAELVVILTQGALATAELTSRRATLEELIAAGIDPSDPANQNIERFEILVGERRIGAYRRGGGGWVAYFNGSGGTGGCASTSCRISDGGRTYYASGTGDTTIVMSVPVEASWLKEFFDVELVVYNNAGPGFTFRGGSATLELPDGLSLANTSGGQSLTSEVPIVYPGDGGAQSVSWLVRGDVAGEYDLSATYRASLEPTGLPVSVTATTETPLKVWGLDAIEYVIEVDDSLTRLSPYHMRVGMRNVADVPVYNARVSFVESDGTDFWYQPEQQLTFTTDVIEPGSTFWSDDLIVIDAATSPFSYVGKVDAIVAGLSTDEYQVVEVPSPGSATLSVASSENRLSLSWQPVLSAEEYRVYNMPTGSSDWELLGVFGSDTTSIAIGYVTEETGGLFAVSTVVDGRLEMFHEVEDDLSVEFDPCADVGHHLGFLWFGTETPDNCSTVRGKRFVTWSAASDASVVEFSVETDGNGTANCETTYPDGTSVLTCEVLPSTWRGFELTVTASDALGSTKRTVMVAVDQAWYDLADWAVFVSDTIRDYYPTTSRDLVTFVDSLGGNPTESQRVALRRLLLVINDSRSARGLMSTQIAWSIAAFESAFSEGLESFLSALPAPDTAPYRFMKEEVLSGAISSLNGMKRELIEIAGEETKGFLEGGAELLLDAMIESVLDGRERDMLTHFDDGYDAMLANFVAGAESYDGDLSVVDAADYSWVTDHMLSAVEASAEAMHGLGLTELLTGSCSQCDPWVDTLLSVQTAVAELLMAIGTGGTSLAPLRYYGIASNAEVALGYLAVGSIMYLDLGQAYRHLIDEGAALGLTPPTTNAPVAQQLFLRSSYSEQLAATSTIEPPQPVNRAMLIASGIAVTVTKDGVPIESDLDAGLLVQRAENVVIVIGPLERLRNLVVEAESMLDVSIASGLGSAQDALSDSFVLAAGGQVRVDAASSNLISALAYFPDAVDDSASTPEDQPVTIQVLDNDSYVDGDLDLSSLNITVKPSSGSVTVEGAAIRYKSNTDFNGRDSFVYQICDLGGRCDTAAVTVTVTAVNDAPVANPDAATVAAGSWTIVDVLANDTDVESTKPTSSVVVGQPAKGTAVGLSNGSIRYTANPGQCGTDTFTYTASDGSASSAPATVTVTIDCPQIPPTTPPTDSGGGGGSTTPTPIETINPGRVYESRAAVTVDGLQRNTGRRAAGSTTSVQVGGRGGVPVDAAAAVVNVVAVGPSAGGYLTLYPCGSARPEASTLNFAAGQTVANGATIRLGSSGSICVFSDQETDLIVDVTGFIPAGSTVGTINPGRVYESRAAVTVDGLQRNTGRRAAGSTTSVQVGGRGGVPVDAAAAVVNVVAVGPSAGGYLTLYPCGSARPEASTLNFAAGQTVANGATIRLGSSGSICVFSDQETDLIVDVTGFIPAGSTVGTINPGRVYESRAAVTVDGLQRNTGRRAAGSTTSVQVGGRGGVPVDAAAAVVNVVAVGPSAGGYLTLYPCGSARPEASTLNFAAGQTVANGATIRLGSSGSICVFSDQETDLIVDVTGFIP